ncbi:hypothetical protein [Pseudotabrizicola algicola]|uniref:Uncharacterized protein n=1 Tax=Pseudotabrizicola algicola TaxID=2709381 RepID=A0A6B3RGV7_9RHOB|nr:hypothetical protein [Pseudotabrizicola algicola]NEX45267.1 hypothetical protein [Pseudotabrizicola algicola]
MSNGRQNALVPVRDLAPARRASSKVFDARAAYAESGPGADPYTLVNAETSLDDRAQVERFLPDILGRALARSWIDSSFRAAFLSDPVRTLAVHRIHLPATIRIDVVTEGQTRPMVVVYEESAKGAPRRRLLYLQLVMVAGK